MHVITAGSKSEGFDMVFAVQYCGKNVFVFGFLKNGQKQRCVSPRFQTNLRGRRCFF